jgi:hypothetical protein
MCEKAGFQKEIGSFRNCDCCLTFLMKISENFCFQICCVTPNAVFFAYTILFNARNVVNSREALAVFEFLVFFLYTLVMHCHDAL